MFTAGRARALLMGFTGVLLAAVTCVAAMPIAQAAPGVRQGPPIVTAASTASISGKVLDADNNTPLARARLVLTSPAITEPRVTISGADGAYTFDRLPAGSYGIAVSRSGYVPAQYGQRRSAPAIPIVVADGQKVPGLDVALARAGIIKGQILDEDGQPFAGANVDALLSRLEDRQATLVSVGSAQTDDRGEFRLTGLPAGQYYVSALDPAFANVGDETGALRYTATYYPGVSLPHEATRVTVVPGVEPALKIIFKLRIVRPARVTGKLTSQDGAQLLSAAVIMSATLAEGLTLVHLPDVAILPDGSFEFRNVPPGRYEVRARGETTPQGTALFGTYRVVVDGRDIHQVDIALVPGATVFGEVLVEARRAPKLRAFDGVRVRAPLAEGVSFGDSFSQDVSPKGVFAIRGLMAGTHVIRVEGLPYPWVLKNVTHLGRDITDSGIEADHRQTFKDVRLTITDVASEITGTVRDAHGTAVPEATIVFVPLSPHAWTRTSTRFGLLRSDAAGRYKMRGLPAGEYRAIASLALEETEVYRVALLKILSKAGVALSLKPLEERVLDLSLSPLAAVQ